MNKYILSLAALVFVVFISKRSYSQCNVAISNIVVEVVSPPTQVSPDKCEVTVNVEFDLAYNNGSKYVYFHAYLGQDYPDFFDCSANNMPAVNPPTSVQLGTAVDDIGKSFLDVGLDNFSGHGPMGIPVNVPILTTYSPDPTVVLTQPSNSQGMTVTKTFTGNGGTNGIDHFVIENLRIVFNQSCGSPLVVKTDLWATNSNAPNSKAQCYQCVVTQFFNDVEITGFKNCNNPRQYAVNISTINPTLQTITYKLYIDVNANNMIDGADILAYNSFGNEVIQISSTQSFSSGLRTYLPWAGDPTYANMNLLILVEGPSLGIPVMGILLDPGCIPLPVRFTTFTAKRTSRTDVALAWQTATEMNNSGFEVQRNTNGNWEVLAFIPSQAQDGYSQALLDYNYNDLNSTKGITQYRIRQIDYDGKTSYTEIRAVRGDGQASKTIVYPNPSDDGKINVVFEELNSSRDLYLVDMAGRMIRNWKNVTNNNIQIDNLAPGMYTLRIYIPAIGDFTAEKFVVNKR